MAACANDESQAAGPLFDTCRDEPDFAELSDFPDFPEDLKCRLFLIFFPCVVFESLRARLPVFTRFSAARIAEESLSNGLEYTRRRPTFFTSVPFDSFTSALLGTVFGVVSFSRHVGHAYVSPLKALHSFSSSH